MSRPVRLGLALFIGAVIFAGLPLVGWGITDIQGFAAHPARLVYVVLVILLQVVVAVAFPGAGRSGGDGTKLVQRQRLAVLLLQAFSLAMLFAAPYSDRQAIAVLDAADEVRYVGLGLFAAGFLLMNWSQAVLGRQFSIQVTIQENHRLVTEGPYKVLRHPRYLGIIVLNVGLALVFRSWLALAVAAALTLVLLWRIRDEEALMSQEFGTTWDAYARTSWHLIPFVY